MNFRNALLMPLLFGTLLASSIAHAELKGRWSGWGEWNYEGSGTRCYDIRFRFEESETELTRAAGRLDCDFVSMDEYPLTLKKEGQNLVSEGQVVGTFNGNNYDWVEPYSENVKIRVSIRRSGLHMDYLENWVEKGDKPLYDIKARLFKEE